MSGQEFLTFFGAPFFAFAVVLAIIPLARRVALKFSFVDNPGGRKQHEEAVPPIGGLVLFPVFMLVGYFSGMDISDYWSLFAALAVLLTVGGADDYKQINPWVKFAAQFVAAGLIVIAGDAQLDNLGNLFGYGTFWIGAIAVPFCVVAAVLLINAINLMDGLDGLAGGKSAVILGWFMIAAAMFGDLDSLLGLCIVIGALSGFLFYNMRHPLQKRACVFLGDAGSMCLGLIIAWFAFRLGGQTPPAMAPISVAWIVALPIFDACGQFYRRVREGRHPFSPDRGHFHHHFIEAGFSVGRATALIMLIGVILGAIGYLGWLAGIPQPVLSYVWIGLLFVHMGLSYRKDRYARLISWVFGARKSGVTSQDFKKLVFMVFVLVCFGGLAGCVSSGTIEKGVRNNSVPVVMSAPQVKRVPSEALLDAQGNWNIVEKDASYDPAKAHMLARQKVDPSRFSKMKDLTPGFEPDAPSGNDGKFRILQLEPQKGLSASGKGLEDYAEMDSGVTERAVVKPSHKVVENDLVQAFKSLFKAGETVAQKEEKARKAEVASANTVAPVPPRPPVRSVPEPKLLPVRDSGLLAVQDRFAQAALRSKPVQGGGEIVGMVDASTAASSVHSVAANNSKKEDGGDNSVSRFFGSLFSSDESEAVHKKAQTKQEAQPVPVVVAQKAPIKVAAGVIGTGALVTGIRSGEHPGRTRLVLDVSSPVTFTANIERIRNVLRIELPKAEWDNNLSGSLSSSTLLGSYVARSMSSSKGTLLEIRLKKPSEIMRVMSLNASVAGGIRIVIDLENH